MPRPHKEQAARLRTALSSSGTPVTVTLSLELLAAAHAVRDWQSLRKTPSARRLRGHALTAALERRLRRAGLVPGTEALNRAAEALNEADVSPGTAVSQGEDAARLIVHRRGPGKTLARMQDPDLAAAPPTPLLREPGQTLARPQEPDLTGPPLSTLLLLRRLFSRPALDVKQAIQDAPHPGPWDDVVREDTERRDRDVSDREVRDLEALGERHGGLMSGLSGPGKTFLLMHHLMRAARLPAQDQGLTAAGPACTLLSARIRPAGPPPLPAGSTVLPETTPAYRLNPAGRSRPNA